MTVLRPPTSHLPPIGKIHQCTVDDLSKALRYLRNIYNPEVRGTRRTDYKKPGSSSPVLNGHLFSLSSEPQLEAIRADSFERSHAMRWLTALVSQAYRSYDPADTNATSVAAQESLVQDAASLLAVCAGPASAGTLTRAFHFQSMLGDISAQLTDVPLENQDYASVGAQTWGSSCLLAEMLADAPTDFDLPLVQNDPNGSGTWRSLELGAGTGLVSITLAKLLQRRVEHPNLRAATVIASDFHPSVLANLASNIEANLAKSTRLSASADFLDWEQFVRPGTRTAPFHAPFDLILGADIVYEAEHARWIHACVAQLLRKPDPADSMSHSAHFHLVIPIRPTHLLECQTVKEVFPLATAERRNTNPRAELALAIVSKNVIMCEGHGDIRAHGGAGGSEVEYVHYVIGWCVIGG